jgi:ATP-dependent DNA ligase
MVRGYQDSGVLSADCLALHWRAVPSRETNAKFIEPMLLLSAETLPEGAGWTYELKLDSYRALGT